MIKTEEAAEPPQAHEKASNNRDSTHRYALDPPALYQPSDSVEPQTVLLLNLTNSTRYDLFQILHQLNHDSIQWAAFEAV